MIHFKYIRIKGFGSISEPFFYDLSRRGINIISGNNGSGKTTIFSALFWVLYGKTLKNNSSVLPWGESKGTYVEVTFRVNKTTVKVIRCKDYKGSIVVGGSKIKGLSKLCILYGGNYLNLKDKRDTQAKIEELLGMSFNLFKNSILFGQNLTRFLKESGPEQKAIFDEAFEITYINKARLLALKKMEALNEELKKLDHSIDLNEEKLKSLEFKKTTYGDLIKADKATLVENLERIKGYTLKLKNLSTPNGSIEILKGRVKSLTLSIKPLKDKSDTLFKEDFKIGQIRAEYLDINSRLKDISIVLAQKIPKCNSCGQVIVDRKLFREKKSKEKQSLLINREALKMELSFLEKTLNKLRMELKPLDKLILEKNALEAQINKQKSHIYVKKEIRDTLKNLRAKNNSLKLTIKGNKRNLAKIKKDRDTLESLRMSLQKESEKLGGDLKLHRWLIQDPLSNKGLKAFIFNIMLNSINKALVEYSKYLGYLIIFSIDLESNNKNFDVKIYQGKQVRNYGDLSGGQQQLVDICLAFSIHDVVGSSKNIKILLMDEVFESLDSSNIELVSDLLQRKAYNSSIHLITHQRNLLFNRVEQEVNLELQRGITKVSL